MPMAGGADADLLRNVWNDSRARLKVVITKKGLDLKHL